MTAAANPPLQLTAVLIPAPARSNFSTSRYNGLSRFRGPGRLSGFGRSCARVARAARYCAFGGIPQVLDLGFGADMFQRLGAGRGK